MGTTSSCVVVTGVSGVGCLGFAVWWRVGLGADGSESLNTTPEDALVSTIHIGLHLRTCLVLLLYFLGLRGGVQLRAS